jgi:hypothetical protein
MSLKKSMMGGTVSGIIIASIPAFIGFFCRFFTPFLMRSPCATGEKELTEAAYSYVYDKEYQDKHIERILRGY